MNAQVTVVVPVYNAFQTLERCLTSLINQTLFRVEGALYRVLVIDDGSKDDSLVIAKKFEASYPLIVTVIQQENRGAAFTRNKGIDICETPYLMFVDNDDYVDSDYIESYLSRICASSADIVIGGFRREDENGVIRRRVVLADAVWSRYRNVAPWGKIYRTDLLKDNHIRFFENNIGEDTIFALKAYQASEFIDVIDSCGYVWYENLGSVSNTIQKGLREDCDIVRMLDAIRDIIPNGDTLGEYFIFRYVVWYLLFSGRTASPARFTQAAVELFDWLETNHVRLGLHVGSKLIASDPLSFKLAVLLISGISKMGLIRLFARFYCKPE